MLSQLQEQVAEIVAGLDEARDFALAGGSALIARGEIQRQTRDLDFFGLEANAVDRLLPLVERVLQAAGLTVRRIHVSTGFARLIVESGEERTELDDAGYEQLREAVERWHEQAIELARRQDP